MKRQGALLDSRANEKGETPMRMNRIPAVTRPCVLLIAAATFVNAQQPEATPPPPDELGMLRQAIEQQSKQLEALTQQVSELNRRMAAQKEPASQTAAPAAASVSPAPAHAPAPATAVAPPADSTPVPAQPGTGAASQTAEPKPEASTPAGLLKHTVAKGETLTSIAKRYNIPLAELEKANKITDDRKLQIGHVLNIPAANKASESPTEKKENP